MEPAARSELYLQVECNFCGSARRVTYCCPDCSELLCENCFFFGKCWTLKKLISKLQRVGALEMQKIFSSDLTLSNLSHYILQDLLPVLECQYDRRDCEEMTEHEPHAKKNPNPQDYPMFHAIQDTLRKKEADKSRCRERFSSTKDMVFQKRAQSQKVFDLGLNNVQVTIEARPREAAVSLVLKWRVQTGLRLSRSTDRYEHLSFDYSNPLLLAISAGVINSEAKYVENASKNLSLGMQPANREVELHCFTYETLENKGIMSFFSRPKPPLALFVKVGVRCFVLDSSLLEAHDEVINARILEIELDHKETFKELKETSAQLLPLIAEVRMKKEELGQTTKQNKKRLEVDGKGTAARVTFESILHPRFFAVLLVSGMLLGVLDWLNPAAVNNLFIG